MSYLQASGAHPGCVFPAVAPRTTRPIDLDWISAARSWWAARRLSQELKALSDELLADIGIERATIDSIARSGVKRAG